MLLSTLYMSLLMCVLLYLLCMCKKRVKEAFVTSLDDIPIIIICNHDKFNQNKVRLNKIGFNSIHHIQSVYIKTKSNSNDICPNMKISRGELGCSVAHTYCYRKVIDMDVPCIILEEDWDYNVSDKILRKKLNDYYNEFVENDIDILWLGHCGDACTQAYIIRPSCAKFILNTNICNKPIDLLVHGLCNQETIKCRKAKSEKKNSNHFGYGLIFQDRINNKGMHDMSNKPHR